MRYLVLLQYYAVTLIYIAIPSVQLVTYNNPDVVCLVETHLRNEEMIEVDDYIFLWGE